MTILCFHLYALKVCRMWKFGYLQRSPSGIPAPAGLPVVLGAGLTTGLAQDSRLYAVPALAEFLGFPLT